MKFNAEKIEDGAATDVADFSSLIGDVNSAFKKSTEISQPVLKLSRSSLPWTLGNWILVFPHTNTGGSLCLR